MDDKTFLEGDHDKFMSSLSQSEVDWMNNHVWSPEPTEMRVFVNHYDVTSFFVSASWSGSKTEIARKAEVTLIFDKSYYTPKLEVKEHDTVQLFAKDEEIFRGYVVEFTKSTNESTVTYVCYDAGFFLGKSRGRYKFFDTPPEEVTRQVCKDFNIPVDHLEKGEPYQRIHDSDTIFDIIMTGYTITSDTNGKQYYPLFEHGALSVYLKGDKVYKLLLSSNHDLTMLQTTRSTMNSINQVKCYNEEGNEIATVKLDTADNFNGILQEIYVAKANENPKKTAKALLKESELTAHVEGFGAIECIAGNAVVISDDVIGLDGLFYIDSDVHTFQDGHHTMRLDVSFENVMYRVKSGKEKEETAEGGLDGVGAGGYTTEERIWNMCRALGYSAAATAGIMGNMEAESGCRPDINEVNGYGGYGLCQWTFGRKPKLINWCKNNGFDYKSVEGQVNFMHHEWKEPYYQQFLSNYQQETDVQRATDRWLTYFEGCTVRTEIVHWPRRLNSAKNFYAKWAKYTKIPAHNSGGGGDVNGSVPGGKGYARTAVLPVKRGRYGLAFPLPNNTGISAFTYPGHTNHARDYQATVWSTPVVSILDGVVLAAGNGVEHWSYGNSVYIQHANGWQSRYAHLNSISVKKGDRVKRGQILGGCGSTGNSSGLHLHMEVHTPWGWADVGGYFSGYCYLTGSE